MIKTSVESIISMLECEYIENQSLDTLVCGVCIDSRQVEPNNLYIPIIGERANGHDYAKQAIEKGASCIMWQKDQVMDIPSDVNVLLVDDTLKALQKLAKAYRDQMSAKFIAITGSNGKTSTKDIVASLMKTKYKTQKTQGNLNSDIGVPLTLLSFDRDLEVGVVEMGMEHPGEISMLSKMVRPDVSIITNVGIAHLENLGSRENIAKAKMEIVDGMNEGILIVPSGDELLKKVIVDKQVNGMIRIYTYGSNQQDRYYYHDVKTSEMGIEVVINDQCFDVDMVGVVQGANACMAYGVAKALYLDDEQIRAGFKHISKTGMRNELVKFGDCLILNDAYKSNPESARAALDTLETFDYDYKIVVLADMLDLGDESDKIHFELGKDLSNYHVNEVLTYGEMGRFIAQGALTYLDENILVRHFETKEMIVEHLQDINHKKCMLLLKGSRGMKLETILNDLMKG